MVSLTAKKELTQDDIAFFKSIIEQYEPYDLDDPRLEFFDDNGLDENRYNATLAKKVLMKAGLLED